MTAVQEHLAIVMLFLFCAAVENVGATTRLQTVTTDRAGASRTQRSREAMEPALRGSSDPAPPLATSATGPASSHSSVAPPEAALHPGSEESSSATTADDNSSDDDSSQAGAAADDASTEQAGQNSQSQPFLNMTLTVPGINSVSELAGTGIIYGIAASQGYGWRTDPTIGDTSGSVSILQPYAGLYDIGHRTSIVGAYHPTIDLFTSNTWDGRVLQRGGFNGAHMLSRRWSMYFSGRALHGPADLRDFQLLSLGDDSDDLEGSTEPLYLLPNDVVTTGSGSLRLRWRRKARQQVSFEFADSYASFYNGTTNNASHGRAQVMNGFGRRSDWIAYGEENRYSDLPNCTRVGFGAGLSSGIGKNTRFGLEGGPQFAVGNCSLPVAVTFEGFFHQRFTHSTALNLRAKRRSVEPTLPDSSGIDALAAGLQQDFTRKVFWATEASYVNAESDGTSLVPEYHGFLLSSRLHWLLSSNLSFVGTYQYLDRNNTVLNLPKRRSWVFFTMIWNSKGRR